MTNKTTQTIVGVIVIIILAVGGYFIFHNSDNGYSTNNNSTGNTPGASQSQSTSSESIIQTKTASGVGKYLADSNGKALYTYGGDTQGVSNCSGSCLYDWPIYPVLSSSSLPANVTVITRSDGTKQYAYKGLPLYTFTSDSAGQVTGDNVSNFHIAKP
ncbi:MAG TPA: hypothetical protein VFW90_02785 [Candidatus Saccharimonadales bacterium]|nr:hypothetical protein [Candidatus Saccharimonadales bacterium]